MAEARSASHWGHTSSLMALVANVNRDPKAKAFEASDFNPYAQRDKPPLPKLKMKEVKGLLMGKSSLKKRVNLGG